MIKIFVPFFSHLLKMSGSQQRMRNVEREANRVFNLDHLEPEDRARVTNERDQLKKLLEKREEKYEKIVKKCLIG